MNINVPLVQIKPKNYISRSAVLTFKVCDYKGFLTYLYEGHGLDSEKASLELLIGSCFHRGRQHLLEHCRVHHPDGKFDDQCIDEAVEKAYELWREELSKRSLGLHKGEEDRLDEVIAEQECLFEGLIRAWALRRLPQILEEYDILEVEQEEVFENFSPLVTWLGKADAMYRRKSDGAIILDSAKTASTYPEVTERNILHDMQGISEWVAANDRLKRYWEDCKRWMIPDHEEELPQWMQDKKEQDLESAVEYFKWMRDLDSPPQVHAVQYDFAIKGQRRKESYTDPAAEYTQQSFLCHPYKKDSLVSFTTSGTIAQGTDEYKWKVSAGKQPKGWRKINIWEDIGVKSWVEMLARGFVQPELGDPFLIERDDEGKLTSGILYTPPLVVRTEFELAEWLISTKFFAERIFQYLELLKIAAENGTVTEYEQTLWKLFPKNTLSCHDFYGRDCQFVVHCHEMQSLQELEQAGYFVPRIPHHDAEKEEFAKKGLIQDDKN